MLERIEFWRYSVFTIAFPDAFDSVLIKLLLNVSDDTETPQNASGIVAM
jgi:hypothetical protein